MSAPVDGAAASVRAVSAPAFGVLGLGHELGEPVEVSAVAAEYTDDLERVGGWGYRTFHRAKDEQGITDLALGAGRAALDRAGVEPGEVDLVVLAVSDLVEYLYWDPAAALQGKLGAHRAEAVLVNQACGGGVTGFDLVAGRLATHPGYRTALLVGANRVCETYWNRMEINTSVFADGAAAAVLRRDHDRGRWLATETITDGRYADFMRMEAGGAANPFTPGTPAVRVGNPFDRLESFFDGDLRRMSAFVATIRSRNREVVWRACERAGVPVTELSRLIHFNDNVRALTELARDLGLPLERTNAAVAREHGHLGCADQLLSLERHLADGDLNPGDVVALTSTSSGMHWTCTLLRV